MKKDIWLKTVLNLELTEDLDLIIEIEKDNLMIEKEEDMIDIEIIDTITIEEMEVTDLEIVTNVVWKDIWLSKYYFIYYYYI